jgi:hypothetical protein
MRALSAMGLVLAALSGPAAPAAAQTIAACGLGPTSPSLTSYDQLTPGGRFHVTLRYDAASHDWLPAPPLGMPLHHASQISYGDFALPPAGTGALELEITAVERTLVRYDERAHTWFFTYRVRVRTACLSP